MGKAGIVRTGTRPLVCDTLRPFCPEYLLSVTNIHKHHRILFRIPIQPAPYSSLNPSNIWRHQSGPSGGRMPPCTRNWDLAHMRWKSIDLTWLPPAVEVSGQNRMRINRPRGFLLRTIPSDAPNTCPSISVILQLLLNEWFLFLLSILFTPFFVPPSHQELSECSISAPVRLHGF